MFLATKLKSKRSFVLILLISLLQYSCEPPGDDRLKILNRSSQEWLFLYSSSDSLPNRCPFPYLTDPKMFPEVPSEEADYRGGREYLLTPNQERSLIAGNGTWEGKIQRSENHALRLFLISPDLIRKKSWKSIRDGKLWTRKYNLTIDTLDRVNWLLTIH